MLHQEPKALKLVCSNPFLQEAVATNYFVAHKDEAESEVKLKGMGMNKNKTVHKHKTKYKSQIRTILM